MKRRTLRLVPVLLLTALLATLGGHGASAQAQSSLFVQPNPANNLDCNSFARDSSQVVRPGMGAICTDPFQPSTDGGSGYRFFDKGHYVGHDEPSVKFISSAPNSGNDMTYVMRLGKDPAAAPTPDGRVSDYAMLSIAPWFGLPMCDPNSYPQNLCTPDSDDNQGLGAPTDSGSAFLEVQFYAPGFGPFRDGVSCDQTQWCAALTIDSLECTFGFAFCNNNCIEPVNFSYIQRDGIPTGPPSPQLINANSLATNEQTLEMNGGDELRVHIHDTANGLEVRIEDLTTGQSGNMVASAANGFMNTNIATCAGTPFDFHPEYNTAAQQNQVPWAALEGGVLMQQELGHFEGCDSVTNPLGFSFDPQTFQTCVGGIEKKVGEGPCTASGCTNSTSQLGPCDAAAAAKGDCEFADASCMPAGPRTTTTPGQAVWSWPINGCLDTVFQNGDLDFDGNSYLPDWPDGTANHPTPFAYAGPFDAGGNPYPSVQIESDIPASESLCDLATGKHCQAPPQGAQFYPFFSIGQQTLAGSNGCFWNFGDRIQGVTTDLLGGTHEYGQADVARFAGTTITPVMPNPQLSSSCKVPANQAH